MDKLENLLAEYERRRAENEKEEQRRRQEIREKHPDLEALLQERHEMVLSSVLSAFSGGEEDAEEKMAAYNRKIAALLTRYGYPEDYLEPVCVCEKCGDAGYVYQGVRQVLCECFQKRLAERTEEAASVETFSTFDESRFPEAALPGNTLSQRSYMNFMRDRCRSFAKNVPSGPVKNLLLHGGSGLGKTFLLHCIEDDVKRRGVDTIFITAYDLLMALKKAQFSNREEGTEIYFTVPLLLVDDLGMEPLIETITVEEIYHLLNDRLSRGLYTAFSTNLDLNELKRRYTERMTSRMLDARHGIDVPLLGRDIRLIK